MKTKSVLKIGKKLSLAALVFTVVGCSGHKFGSPTEKYGNLNHIAEDTVMKEVQPPSVLPTTQVRVDADREYYQGAVSFFEVKVTMPSEGFRYDLSLDSGGVGSFAKTLKSQSGLTDTWTVQWSIGEILLNKEPYRSVTVEAQVRYTDYPSELYRSAFGDKTVPSERIFVNIVRSKILPEIKDFRAETHGEPGGLLDFEVIVDPKGADLSELSLMGRAEVLNCQVEASECAKVDQVDIGALELANDHLRAQGAVDLRAVNENSLGLNSEQPTKLLVTLTLNYQQEKVVRAKDITLIAKNELEEPKISWEESSSFSVLQGENFQSSFTTEAGGAVLLVDEAVFREAVAAAGLSAQTLCASKAAGTLSCDIVGTTSCETAVGTIELPIRVSSKRGVQEKATAGQIEIEVLAGETCEEQR